MTQTLQELLCVCVCVYKLSPFHLLLLISQMTPKMARKAKEKINTEAVGEYSHPSFSFVFIIFPWVTEGVIRTQQMGGLTFTSMTVEVNLIWSLPYVNSLQRSKNTQLLPAFRQSCAQKHRKWQNGSEVWVMLSPPLEPMLFLTSTAGQCWW